MFTGANVHTVGDLGTIKQALPHFIIPQVPYTLETLQIILPFSVSMAIVGLVESLLTAKIVDEFTNTYSSKIKNLAVKVSQISLQDSLVVWVVVR